MHYAMLFLEQGTNEFHCQRQFSGMGIAFFKKYLGSSMTWNVGNPPSKGTLSTCLIHQVSKGSFLSELPFLWLKSPSEHLGCVKFTSNYEWQLLLGNLNHHRLPFPYPKGVQDLYPSFVIIYLNQGILTFRNVREAIHSHSLFRTDFRQLR
ncbi:hypothetical protein AM1_C0308 (plasmid) [Acaryochloris marina MBIC11017]|uniref:Uncharacterized protein n=1 Tax=Acaryochloris marina (strain MBIC 11017) TaxID=329726 RepID=A8ZN37_ACAM1|nr:hypothetical protein AM1_C0308 [Acaryochloris marina MBIC11017]